MTSASLGCALFCGPAAGVGFSVWGCACWQDCTHAVTSSCFAIGDGVVTPLVGGRRKATAHTVQVPVSLQLCRLGW